MIYGYENIYQLSLILKAAGFGFLTGGLYILCRSVIFLSFRDKTFRFISDLLFFLIMPFLVFMFFMKYNSGIFRLPQMLSLIAGFCIFMFFPGKILLKSLDLFTVKASSFTRKTVKKIALHMRKITVKKL